MNLVRNKHLYVDNDAMKEIIIDFKNARVKKGFGNGRYVENFLIKIEEEHILNVSKEISKALKENYIVYSKGEKSGGEGDEVIYISRIVNNSGTLEIEEITNDEEWANVQTLLKKIANA